MNDFFKKRKVFNQICKGIKELEIQGATNIAKKALEAYQIFPFNRTKKKLLLLRPTEPMLSNVLERIEKQSYNDLIKHFSEAQEKINKNVLKLIKSNDIIFTHCHSTNVVRALIFAKKHEKKFQVYNTETRPLYQGRKTSRELSSGGIKVTQFVDSAMAVFIEKENKKDQFFSTKIFLGADAITNQGIINKIGSKLIAEIAHNNKVPLYIIADSWKFTDKKVSIENRNLNEVWNKVPKKVKVQNPAFEFVPKKYIKAIVSEFGILKYDNFLKKIK